MTKKKKVRDRYFSEDQPSNNLDFVEVSIHNMDALDAYINQSPLVQQALGKRFFGEIKLEGEKDKDKGQIRTKRLLQKVLKAAATCLTDRQFQVFILRFLFNLTEEEIAERLVREYVGRPRLDNKRIKMKTVPKKVSQPYCSEVIERCVVKIKKELRLKSDVPE